MKTTLRQASLQSLHIRWAAATLCLGRWHAVCTFLMYKLLTIVCILPELKNKRKAVAANLRFIFNLEKQLSVTSKDVKLIPFFCTYLKKGYLLDLGQLKQGRDTHQCPPSTGTCPMLTEPCLRKCFYCLVDARTCT